MILFYDLSVIVVDLRFREKETNGIMDMIPYYLVDCFYHALKYTGSRRVFEEHFCCIYL